MEEALKSITTARCVRCGHRILEHGAEGDRPDIHPGYMVCEQPGCECVDFHLCFEEDCPECSGSEDPARRFEPRVITELLPE